MGLMSDFRTRVDDVGWSARVIFNEFMKFNIVGCFNSAFAFLLYLMLYQINLWDAHTAVAAWVVSSIIGNIEAHFMHYRFTFKSTFRYAQSLNRAFWCYTSLLVVTTTMEYIMIELSTVWSAGAMDAEPSRQSFPMAIFKRYRSR